MVQHLARRRLLDKLAVPHDHDPIGHLGDDSQIMRDIDGSGLELENHILYRGKDLDLRRNIQCCGRFVENDEIGPARHGHCGHRALQLAPRDLVGIALPDVLGIGQPQAPIDVSRVLSRLFFPHQTML